MWRVLFSAQDGAALELASWGSGPGLVVVVDGAADLGTYRRLAERMSAWLPVHVYKRRGRGASATKPANYGLATEVADLATVMPETRLALAGDSPASAWADVTVQTRFFIGANSPDYYLPSAQRLVAAMPDASMQVLPRLGHDHLARANHTVIEALTGFLSPMPTH